MALRFVDSFDHYATADIGAKYTSSNSPTIGATGRNSTNGMRCSDSGRGATKVIDSQATWIVGFAFRYATVTTARAILTLIDNATTHVDLRLNTDGTMTATRNGTSLGSGTAVLSAGTYYYIECKVTINDSTGVFVTKVNGTTDINLSSQDTRNAANSTANTIELATVSSGITNLDYDDLYICDGTDGTATQGAPNNDFLGDVRVEASFVTGAGNSAQFTPSASTNASCVDEAAANGDTDYNSDSTSGHIDSFAMSNLTATSGTVIGVQYNLWARKDDAGTRALQPLVRISSTNYTGTSVNLTDTYLDRTEVVGKSPASGTAWTISEINGMEFGYKVP